MRWREEELPAGGKVPIPPGYGVALATGARSGVVVIDLDFRPGGVNGLETLAALSAGEIPPTLTVATPTGGFHLYFAHPGFPVRNSAGKIGAGIDVRGDGGMVVLPPSPHRRGGTYEFLDPLAELLPLPPWLSGRLVSSPGGAVGAPWPVPPRPVDLPANGTTQEGWAVIDRVCAELRKCPEGRRNDLLFRLCAELGDFSHVGDVSLDDARGALLPVLAAAGWGDPEKSRDTIERGFEKGREKGDRPLVVIGPDHLLCNDAAIPALGAREDVYVIGNTLARDTGGNGIASMSLASLGECLSRCVDWRTRTSEGVLRRAHPPAWAVSEIYARGYWDGLRVVDGFSDVPVLRPDGSVAEVAGYDASTRVVLRGGTGVDPCSLSEARELFDDLLVDFPFADPSHKAATLCALLTPLAIHAYTGPTPLFLFEASTAGSGKTLLATVCALIGSGLVAPVSMFTDDEEEMRKRITTLAQRPKPVTLFDNVGKGTKLGGPVLSAVLTSPDRVWTDRLLGGNVQFSGILNTVFYATSNQTELAEDMHRRVCPTRLVPDVELPENRTGFRHPDLLGYVTQHRRRLTSAGLALLQDQIRRGRPSPGGSGWGSFHGWRDLVLGAVASAGWGTPDRAVTALRDSSSLDAEEGPELFEALEELLVGQRKIKEGLSVQEILDVLYPRTGLPGGGGVRLRAMLDAKYPKGTTAKNFGYLLRNYAERVFNNQKLIPTKRVTGGRKWALGR